MKGEKKVPVRAETCLRPNDAGHFDRDEVKAALDRMPEGAKFEIKPPRNLLHSDEAEICVSWTEER